MKQQIVYKIRHAKTGKFLCRELNDSGVLVLFEDTISVSQGSFYSSINDALLEFKSILKFIDKAKTASFYDIRISKEELFNCEIVEFSCSEINASSILYDLDKII